MSYASDAGTEFLRARLNDLISRCDRGEVAVLSFLTPRERKLAERLLRENGYFSRAWFWGGYEGAERTALFLIPDFLCACLSDELSRCGTDEVLSLLGEDASAVAPLRIRGSGFRELCHRDYLGSLLALGLERDALGDVAVQNPHEAVLFCSGTLIPFLKENLVRVASDAVRCEEYIPDESFTDGRKYEPIRDTVASARLDCVVAALTGLSREGAQEAIRNAEVEVNFEAAERNDMTLVPPVTLSVRGYGRYVLRSFDGETKKGRLRLSADHLV